MASSSETPLSPPRLEIITDAESSQYPLSTTHEEKSDDASEHGPDTPTSSTSSTSSFTTVTADLSSSYTAEMDPRTSYNNATLPSSNPGPSPTPKVVEPTLTPTPPRTTRRKSRISNSSSVQGLDDNTPTDGNVIDFRTEQPVSRRE